MLSAPKKSNRLPDILVCRTQDCDDLLEGEESAAVPFNRAEPNGIVAQDLVSVQVVPGSFGVLEPNPSAR